MISDQSRAFYERTSDRYWSPATPVGRDLHVIPLIGKKGGRYLEYGFGSGSLLFSQAHNFEEIIGYEISSNLISKAESYKKTFPQSVQEKIRFLVADGDCLKEIEDESLNVIIAVAVIEHMFDPYKILDEFHRTCKKDGRLIVSVPNYGYVKHRLSLLFGRLPKTGTDDPIDQWRHCGWDGGHLHTFTKRAFNILLTDTGWHPLLWSGWGNRFSTIRSIFPGILSGELFSVCFKKQ